MLTFIKQKLLYKKWLNICLLIGIIILTAVAACLPMYQNLAENQAFQNLMKEYINEEERYPSVITLSNAFAVEEGENAYKAATEQMNKCDEILDDDLHIKPKERIKLFTIREQKINPLQNAGNSVGANNYRLSVLSDFQNHIKLAAGCMFDDTASVKRGTPEEGVISFDQDTKYTCVVSAALLEESGFYIGQTLEFEKMICQDNAPLRVTITGVFEEKESEDTYWVNPPLAYTRHLFVSEAMMSEILDDVSGEREIAYKNHNLYDYENMYAKELQRFYRTLKHYTSSGFENGAIEWETDFFDLLDAYMENARKIKATLWILELPMLVLILVFIYMISSQILELEGNEIAVLKSRGVSIKQIVWLYFVQSSLLAGIGVLIGLPMGYGLCRLFGQSDAFLEFVSRADLTVKITASTMVYCIAAAVFAVAFMTLPLLHIAREDIVSKKSKRGKSDVSLWERYYIDVILLAVSGYAYYSFQKQRGEIASKVLNGDGLDPFLFLGATLFMLSLGMLVLRVFRLLVKLIYIIGKKKWSPAMYASFLQILRTKGKQGFISLFLIVTLSMGIFYSNIARTINQNEEDRALYNLGTDIVLKEEWIKMAATRSIAKDKQEVSFYYVEPSTNLFSEVREVSESATKVLQRNVGMKGAKDLTKNGRLMAIHTKEFGSVAWMRDGTLDKHWYHYLNDLADASQNVLVSSNAKTDFGLKIGDSIKYFPSLEEKNTRDTLGTVTGTICGFVDAWPGFSGYQTVTDEKGVRKQEPVYLIVANYGFIESTNGTQPCEIWAKTGGKNQDIFDITSRDEIHLEYSNNANTELILAKQTSIIQITNGMLTMSFLVVLVLCMIGFLIYWIISIRQRELLFGIYRAMGMSMREIIGMLVNEQVFCSLLAIICGVISGIVTSRVFISLIVIAYAPESHCLPYILYSSPKDMVRMGIVVTFILGSCIFILAKMLSKMKVAQVIKLGED